MAMDHSQDDSLDSVVYRQIRVSLLQDRYDASPITTANGIASPTLVRHSHSLANAGPPALRPHHSAPDMGAVLREPSSQRGDALTKAATFHGIVPDFDGDTQPLPSQVYRDFTSHHATFRAPHDSDDTHLRAEEEQTQMDMTPVKNGMVDLMAFCDTQSQYTAHRGNDPAGLHSIVDSTEDLDTQRLLSSMARETHLKTPAIAGQKRDRYGHTISPTTVSKTPGSGLTNAFGPVAAGRTLMTATQMFEATQGESSPLADLARSDPAETRPSPEFAHHTDASPSMRALSSPTKPTFASSYSRQGAPRDVYRRMDESQEQRTLMRNQQDLRPPASSKVTFDFDDDSQDRLLHTRAKSSDFPSARKAHDHGLNGPRRGSTPLASRTTIVIPETTKRIGQIPVIEVSDNESEPDVDDEDESLDEYDELEQDIRPSQRGSASQNSRHRSGTPEIMDDEMEVAGSPLPPLTDDLPGENETNDDLMESITFAAPVVANSQVSGAASSRPPPFIEPSSISSFVPASQLVPVSSQTRERILDDTESSAIPLPPASTNVEDVAIMPSSPPMAQPLDSSNDKPVADMAPLDTGNAADQPVVREPLPPVEPPGIEQRLADKSTSGNHSKPGAHSTISDVFATAATHIDTPSSTPKSATEPRRQVSESPQKSGMRTLGDIANDSTPPNTAGEIDLSIGMQVVENTDHDFARAMAPPGKLRSVKSARQAPKSRKAEQSTLVNDTSGARREEPNVPNAASKEQIPERQPRKRRRVASTKATSKKAKYASTIPETEQNGSDDPKDATIRTVDHEPSTLPQVSHESGHGHAVADDAAQPEDTEMAIDQAQPTEGDYDQLNSAGQTSQTGVKHDRVLALFNGSVHGYYPATCTSVSGLGSSSKLGVRFDDGSCTTLDRHHVCAFDLRAEDVVKVDLAHMKTHTYTITSLERQAGGSDLVPDNKGNTHALVQIKRKDSARNPQVNAARAVFDRPVKVPVGAIYLTQTMWSKFSSRTYEHPFDGARQQTPSVDLTAPPTPTSRTRRQTINSGGVSAVTPVDFHRPCGTTFRNMAFVVSWSQVSDTRDEMVSLITSHGGLIFNDGLHELFDLPTADLSDLSDLSPSTPAHQLVLKPQYSTLGFVALIADSHARRQKYMQALALSLPTLHYKWIEDSLAAGHALQWPPYLLPAGESFHLHRAVRSSSLAPYDPATAAFARTLAARPRLPDVLGAGVILLAAPPKGRTVQAGRDRRQLFAFLSLAMGAARAALADDVPAVRAALAAPAGGGGGAEWRFVHCGDEAPAAVAAALEGSGRAAGPVGNAKGGRRRGRGGEREEEKEPVAVGVGERVRVVNDEWVIQRLIFGA